MSYIHMYLVTIVANIANGYVFVMNKYYYDSQVCMVLVHDKSIEKCQKVSY